MPRCAQLTVLPEAVQAVSKRPKVYLRTYTPCTLPIRKLTLTLTVIPKSVAGPMAPGTTFMVWPLRQLNLWRIFLLKTICRWRMLWPKYGVLKLIIGLPTIGDPLFTRILGMQKE